MKRIIYLVLAILILVPLIANATEISSKAPVERMDDEVVDIPIEKDILLKRIVDKLELILEEMSSEGTIKTKDLAKILCKDIVLEYENYEYYKS